MKYAVLNGEISQIKISLISYLFGRNVLGRNVLHSYIIMHKFDYGHHCNVPTVLEIWAKNLIFQRNIGCIL
jgi:hypothetical protein